MNAGLALIHQPRLTRCFSSILVAARGATAATCMVLVTQRRYFIEHSTDPKRWRSSEKEEVRRRYGGKGVPLGSEFAKIREREQIEKRLIEEDKVTNWRMVYGFGLFAALLLIGLNLLMEFVKPNPSPEYIPCLISKKVVSGFEKDSSK